MEGLISRFHLIFTPAKAKMLHAGRCILQPKTAPSASKQLLQCFKETLFLIFDEFILYFQGWKTGCRVCSYNKAGLCWASHTYSFHSLDNIQITPAPYRHIMYRVTVRMLCVCVHRQTLWGMSALYLVTSAPCTTLVLYTHCLVSNHSNVSHFVMRSCVV